MSRGLMRRESTEPCDPVVLLGLPQTFTSPQRMIRISILLQREQQGRIRFVLFSVPLWESGVRSTNVVPAHLFNFSHSLEAEGETLFPPTL